MIRALSDFISSRLCTHAATLSADARFTYLRQMAMVYLIWVWLTGILAVVSIGWAIYTATTPPELPSKFGYVMYFLAAGAVFLILNRGFWAAFRCASHEATAQARPAVLPQILPLPIRILIAVSYAGLGVYLLSSAYFTPWYPHCWIWFGYLFGWAAAGIALDPFRFLPARSILSHWPDHVVRFIRRWPVLVFFVLVVSPWIFYAAHLFWMFVEPWNWLLLDLGSALVSVFLVRLFWSNLASGRLFCLLLLLLLAHHLSLMLLYAGATGGPEYLRNDVTQFDFLLQLWFRLLAALVTFWGLEIRTFRKASLRPLS